MEAISKAKHWRRREENEKKNLMDLMKSSFPPFCWVTFRDIDAEVDINRFVQKQFKNFMEITLEQIADGNYIRQSS